MKSLVARRKDRCVKRFVLNSSVVRDILLCVVKLVIYLISYFVLPISVNKDVCAGLQYVPCVCVHCSL